MSRIRLGHLPRPPGTATRAVTSAPATAARPSAEVEAAQCPLPHGLLDEVKRQRRRDRCDEHPEHQKRHAVQAGAARVEEYVDGPVPQVEPVGDDTDRHRRLPGQEPGHRSRPSGGRRDHRSRRGGHGEEPAPEEAGCVGVHLGQGDEKRGQCCESQTGDDPPRRRSHQREQDGDRSAEQQPLGPGVGAVVDARGIRPWNYQDGHQHGRGDGAGEENHRGRPATTAHGDEDQAEQQAATRGRTAPRSPATTCAAAASGTRTARSTTGPSR